MGYNVDHVECLSGELTISEEGKAWLVRAENGEGPEWFPEIGPRIGDDDTVIMRWSGEGSGNAASARGIDPCTRSPLEEFFSFTRGTAEFVFYWEGGESRSGYRVVDGAMKEYEVEIRLGAPISRKNRPLVSYDPAEPDPCEDRGPISS